MSAVAADPLAPLVCPRCRGPLAPTAAGDALLCRGERLAFPVRDGVPLLLIEEALPIEEARPPAADEECR